MVIRTNSRGVKRLYIEWAKDSELVLMKDAELEELIKKFATLIPDGYIKCRNGWNTVPAEYSRYATKTSYIQWCDCQDTHWTIDVKGKDVCLYVAYSKDYIEEHMNECEGYEEGVTQWYDVNGLYRYSTAKYIEKEDEVGGTIALDTVKKMFLDEHKETLYKAVGTMGVKEKMDYFVSKGKQVWCPDTTEQDLLCTFNEMQASAMIWTDPSILGTTLYAFNKGDFHSAYPANSFRIPDWKNRKEISGRVDLKDYPEYDIAYYVKSQHIVERGVFDTREMITNPWFNRFNKQRFGVRIASDDEERTILCKYSPYSLENIMTEIYKSRKKDKDAKAVSVCLFGMLRSLNYNWQHYMGQYTALVYLRHEQKMLDKIKEIEDHNGRIVMLATDSIGWIGGDDNMNRFGGNKLGEFGYEHVNSVAIIRASGFYAIKDPNHPDMEKQFVLAHQGIALNEEQLKEFARSNDLKKVMKLKVQIKERHEETHINGIKIPEFVYRELQGLELMDYIDSTNGTFCERKLKDND